MTEEETNLATVRSYYAAMAAGAPVEAMNDFYSPDVVQLEFPNRYLPNGAERGLKELMEAGVRGKALMASQEFEIRGTMASGNTVVVEAAWSGTLRIAAGDVVPAGTVMRARFAQFFEFRDGKIVAQRNYDCFYPW